MRFWGYAFPTWTDGNCPIAVTVQPLSAAATVAGATATASSTFQYQTSLSPNITAVSPNNGSSLGNTLLTITGTGFGTGAVSDLDVMVNGVMCTVKTYTPTQITCLTGVRPPPPAITRNSFSVSSDALGTFLIPTTAATTPLFRYLDR